MRGDEAGTILGIGYSRLARSTDAEMSCFDKSNREANLDVEHVVRIGRLGLLSSHLSKVAHKGKSFGAIHAIHGNHERMKGFATGLTSLFVLVSLAGFFGFLLS